MNQADVLFRFDIVSFLIKFMIVGSVPRRANRRARSRSPPRDSPTPRRPNDRSAAWIGQPRACRCGGVVIPQPLTKPRLTDGSRPLEPVRFSAALTGNRRSVLPSLLMLQPPTLTLLGDDLAVAEGKVVVKRIVITPAICAAVVAVLTAADVNDWPSHDHDAGGRRFSPLTQITPANVATLQPAWTFDTGASGIQVTPLVVGGLMY